MLKKKKNHVSTYRKLSRKKLSLETNGFWCGPLPLTRRIITCIDLEYNWLIKMSLVKNFHLCLSRFERKSHIRHDSMSSAADKW